MLHSLPHQNADLFCTEGSSAYSSDPLTKLQAVHELASRALAEDLRSRDCLTSPGAVGEYLRHRLSGLPHEVFVCIQLDAQHRVIAIKELFPGTLTQTSVYPREFVMASLRANAAAVIFDLCAQPPPRASHGRVKPTSSSPARSRAHWRWWTSRSSITSSSRERARFPSGSAACSEGMLIPGAPRKNEGILSSCSRSRPRVAAGMFGKTAALYATLWFYWRPHGVLRLLCTA